MKAFIKIIALLAAVTAGVIITRSIMVNETIEQLLTENQDLKESITSLTHVEQIGYAKVISQETRDETLFTRLIFVETDPSDPGTHIFTREYEIQGDVIHFDAIIIKFSDQLVIDGKERAIYLWRRIYGESMTPAQGLPIETPGEPSPRYAQLSDKLNLSQSQLLWTEIWNLADNPKKLESLGVQAVFGNTVYRRLKPGLIYVFKVSSTGSLYPETVPDL